MRTLRFLWPLVLLPGLASCHPPGPQRAYHAALESYNGALATLVRLRQAGVIDDAEARTIERVRQTAEAALDAWRGALERGESPSQAIDAFNRAIDRLIAATLNAQHAGDQP